MGYRTTNSLLIDQLEISFNGNDHQAFIYEQHREVLGFISLHFAPQVAFAGELAVITCLAVDESAGDRHIDKALEDYVTKIAINRNCERITALNHELGTIDYKFFEQQGYMECPKYYSKRLI